MTISDGITTKTLALYSPAQPQFDQEKVVWPDIGEEFNFVQQLMMLTRKPFTELQEDDKELSNIIRNYYEAYQQLSGMPICPLHTLLPTASSLDSPIATEIFHTLLLQEIQTSSLSKIYNIESITQVEDASGRNLDINS